MLEMSWLPHVAETRNYLSFSKVVWMLLFGALSYQHDPNSLGHFQPFSAQLRDVGSSKPFT